MTIDLTAELRPAQSPPDVRTPILLFFILARPPFFEISGKCRVIIASASYDHQDWGDSLRPALR
jgi:hypothetical protein